MKCNPDDTIGDLKKLIAAQTGTKYDKIVLKKWYTIYKDNIKLSDCKSTFFSCAPSYTALNEILTTKPLIYLNNFR